MAAWVAPLQPVFLPSPLSAFPQNSQLSVCLCIPVAFDSCFCSPFLCSFSFLCREELIFFKDTVIFFYAVGELVKGTYYLSLFSYIYCYISLGDRNGKTTLVSALGNFQWQLLWVSVFRDSCHWAPFLGWVPCVLMQVLQ
jgi:hypothetical protein